MVFHEGKRNEPIGTAQLVVHYVEEYKAAQHPFSHPRPPDSTPVWSPPAAGVLKINFDASISQSPPFAGLNVVARNNNGKIVAWRTSKISFIQESELAEAMDASLVIQLTIRLH